MRLALLQLTATLPQLRCHGGPCLRRRFLVGENSQVLWIQSDFDFVTRLIFTILVFCFINWRIPIRCTFFFVVILVTIAILIGILLLGALGIYGICWRQRKARCRIMWLICLAAE